jgi:REP element-mobilizing transposase RayT
MPRLSRSISSTGVYHVMLRGIDKRLIFHSDFDYLKFLYYLEKTWINGEFDIYAYCLMSNHVHLLISYSGDDIGNIIRRITVGYVQYFNYQNSRYGHMFQNRFKSEVVQDDSYFLTVMRYIHRNPVKANIVVSSQDFPWCSYQYYLGISRSNQDLQKPAFLNTSYVLNMVGDKDELVKHMHQDGSDECLDFDERSRLTDDQLLDYIKNTTGLSDINILNKSQKMEICKEAQSTIKTSTRQLMRVLHFHS